MYITVIASNTHDLKYLNETDIGVKKNQAKHP